MSSAVLNPAQSQDLVMLLGKALRPDALVWMVDSVLGREAVAGFGDKINTQDALAARAVQLLEEAGKTPEAIQLLLSEGTPNTHLVFGLRAIESDERLSEEMLQSFTNDFEPFMSTAGVGDLVIRLRRVVCAIGNANEHSLKGTGFLIGPDLVLTNYHVIKEFTQKVDGRIVANGEGTGIWCYFDYLWPPKPPVPPGTAQLNTVAVKAVKDQWLIHSRPSLDKDGTDECAEPRNNELDYAVIRLSEAVGLRPVRKSGGALRGWIPLETEIGALNSGARLMLVQHPGGVFQQFDLGEYKRLAVKETRVWYSLSAAKGSSGGATVRIDGKLFALHNAAVKRSDTGQSKGLHQGIRIDYIAKDLPKSVLDWGALDARSGQNLGYHWSLTDDPTHPQPIIGRTKLRDAMARMRQSDGKRAMVVRGPLGSGVRFSRKLLRRVHGVRAPIVEFSPEDLASLKPRAFLKVLAEQLGLSRLSDHPIPEPKGTENTSRWLRNDLPEWLFARLTEDAARRRAEYPAWVVIDAMTPGKRLSWAENLPDLLAALVGVREPTDTAPDITQLRWLFLTEDRDPVPLTGVSIEEDDLSVYSEAEYSEDFSRCMVIAWHCLDPEGTHNDKFVKSVAIMTVMGDAGRSPVRKVLARAVQTMLSIGRTLVGDEA